MKPSEAKLILLSPFPLPGHTCKTQSRLRQRSDLADDWIWWNPNAAQSDAEQEAKEVPTVD